MGGRVIEKRKEDEEEQKHTRGIREGERRAGGDG